MSPLVWLGVPSPQPVEALTTSTKPARVHLGPFFPSPSSAAPAMSQAAGAYLTLSVPEELGHSSCYVVSLSPQSLTQIPSPFRLMQMCLPVSEELSNQVGNGTMLIQVFKDICSWSSAAHQGMPMVLPGSRCPITGTRPVDTGWRKSSLDWGNWASRSMLTAARWGGVGDVTHDDVSMEIKAAWLSQLSIRPHSHTLEIHLWFSGG